MNAFMGTREASTVLGVHQNTVLNLIKRGELQAVKVGGVYRIYDTVLTEYLHKNTSVIK